MKHSFCALKWVHDLCPSPPGGNPADTPFSRNIVESSRRVYAKPVNKKEPISSKILERIYHRYAAPNSSLQDLRTALIFVLGFSGLFRANELLDLKTTDISIKDRHLEIYVRKSKTDQYRGGNIVYIAKTNGQVCPHALLSRYYSLAGINAHTAQYIFRSLQSLQRPNDLSKQSDNHLSYTRCREIIKESLRAIGENPALYSTHSLRSGGATFMAEALEESQDKNRLIRLQGRWKSESSRDMYIKDSIEKRLSLTKSLT